MIVNHQAHWYPPAYLDSICGREGYPRAEKRDGGRYFYEMGPEPGAWRFEIRSRFWNIEEQIADLDASGIDVAVINPNMVGEVAGLDLGEARETIAMLNAETARVQRQFPDRIAGLAMLPMQDVDAALEALDRAVELDLRGVLMLSNLGGAPLGEAETWPVYERIDELGLPIYLHPANNSMVYDHGIIPILDSALSWVSETSLAAFSLILSGLLDRCPGLQIVQPHLGGVIPYVVGRVARYEAYFPTPLEHSLDHYLKTRFYIDTVTHTPAAIPLAIETYGADRIVYGDDYPWHDHGDGLRVVEEQFSPDLRQTILHDNQVATLRIGHSTASAER